MVSKDKLVELLRSNNIDKIKLFNRYNRLVRFFNKCIDLSYTDLSRLDLRGANLFNVNLSNANLNNVNLSNSILYKANLSNAILNNTKFKRTDLSNTYLKYIIINNIKYNTEILIKLMQDNKEKILTVDFCSKEGLCEEGIQEFIDDYELEEEKLLGKYNDSIFLGDLAEHNKIEDMLNNSYFLYIILKICNII
jgi:uncharacterized protein YjbI with pentapeptide repeats